MSGPIKSNELCKQEVSVAPGAGLEPFVESKWFINLAVLAVLHAAISHSYIRVSLVRYVNDHQSKGPYISMLMLAL